MKTSDIHYPTLLMIRGLPGSGKTYLADRLVETLGDERVVVLDPDTVDLTAKDYLAFSAELEAEGLDKALHPFRWSRKLACEGVAAGNIVIWNQPFTIRGIFERLVAFIEADAKEHGIDLPVLVVEVEIDEATAKQRIVERKQAGGHGPSDGTFGRRVGEYESYVDGFETVVVQGRDDIAASLTAVMEKLGQLR